VRPTQVVQIFGNISTALGTLAIHWHPLLGGASLNWPVLCRVACKTSHSINQSISQAEQFNFYGAGSPRLSLKKAVKRMSVCVRYIRDERINLCRRWKLESDGVLRDIYDYVLVVIQWLGVSRAYTAVGPAAAIAAGARQWYSPTTPNSIPAIEHSRMRRTSIDHNYCDDGA